MGEPVKEEAGECGTEKSTNRDRSSSWKKKKTPYISVREMGDMLGLKKTERYWLVRKKLFKTETAGGKIWVETASFEKWYANQNCYHKVNGEEPGAALKKKSYSVQDISEILGICKVGVYGIIKKNNIKTLHDKQGIRVPIKDFRKWYESQDHYRTVEDRKKEEVLEAASVSMPEMAGVLGISRNKVYKILQDERYRHFFDFVTVGNRKRITKESLQRFLEGQSVYKTVFERVGEISRKCCEENGQNLPPKVCMEDDRQPYLLWEECADNDHRPGLSYEESSDNRERKDHTEDTADQIEKYLTMQEAAEMAGITRQALRKYVHNGVIKNVLKIGNRVYIPRQEFGQWMIRRILKEGE